MIKVLGSPRSLTLAAFTLAFSMTVPSVSKGDVILQPVSASTDMGTFGGNPPVGAINQSALSPSYTSGVTNFGTFAGSATHIIGSAGDGWASDDIEAGNFDLDMGAAVTVDSMALWSLSTAAAVNSFELFADDNSGFSSPTSLGTGSFSLLSDPQHAQVFSFAPTTAQFLRLQINSNHGSVRSGFGEIAFRQAASAAVPEPSSLALVGLAAVGIGLVHRRKRRAKAQPI